MEIGRLGHFLGCGTSDGVGIPYLGNSPVLVVGVSGLGRMGRMGRPEDPICLGIRIGPFFFRVLQLKNRNPPHGRS